MRNFKAVLSVFLTLMIVSAFCVTAFAAAPEIALRSVKTDEGCVSIGVYVTKGFLTSSKFNIRYDNSALEFSGYDNPSETDLLDVRKGKTENCVTVSFASASAVNGKSFVTVNFKITNEEVSVFEFACDEVYSYCVSSQSGDTAEKTNALFKGVSIDLNASADDFMLGDVDFDGEIKAADARIALRGSVGLENWATDSTSKEYRAADVDKDGLVKAADARIILRVAVGLESFS